MLKLSKVAVLIGAALVAGLLAMGTLGKEQSTPASAVSEEQIKAGLQVLQNTGNPTPLLATTVKGTKSNSDNRLGPMSPAPNVSGNGAVMMTANLNLSKSSINRIMNVGGASTTSAREEELAVGVITLLRPMKPKKAEEKRLIPVGKYGVGILMIAGESTPLLAMFPLDTDEPAELVVSVEAAALIQATSDEFTHSLGIPCLLGDEYTAAILLNLLASMLEEVDEAATSAPDLALEKTLDGTLNPERQATYLLRIMNVGGASTTSAITVLDSLPEGLAFVSASGPDWTCFAFGTLVTCTTAAKLAPGQTSMIQLTVQVRARTGTELKNCALVKTDGDVNLVNDQGCNTSKVQ